MLVMLQTTKQSPLSKSDMHESKDFLSESVEEECRESSSSFEASSIEEKHGNDSGGSEEWISSVPVAKDEKAIVEYVKPKCSVSDIDMMKERFAKLLLGEDMSGCGHGACTALTISNAITNLSATLFGQLWRLEPLPSEKKSMWKREMEWLLCVSDHIVELKPSRQIFPDGSESEVMTCRPRPDLYINLPALRKFDNMLLEILDNFCDSEFKYADKGIKGSDTDVSTSFRMSAQRQVEKWWLPMLQVPPGGLSESSRKKLQHKHECTNQILKAVMAINSNTLAEMQVPQSYLDSLPKNVRECLGDVMYRNITSDKFSPECFLDCLEFTSEHRALEIANSVEASIYIWRQNTPCPNPRASWGLIREKSIGTEKRELFAARAESLLSCLKNRFPGLSQTSLDTIKIQFNKDVGKSILESYSRVLESLASNIVARIDDVLYIDDLVKKPEVPPVTSTTNRIALLPNSNNNNSRVVPARLPSPGIGKKSPLRTRIPSGFGFTFRE